MSYPVGVSVRFVPGGIERIDGQWLLRGTLVLAPVAGPAAATCGSTVDLAEWPKAIEALVKGADGAVPSSGAIAIAITPVIGLPKSAKRPVPKETLGESDWIAAHRAYLRERPVAQRKAAEDHREKDVGNLNKMWATLLAPHDRTDWENLLKVVTPPTGPGESIVDDIARKTAAGAGSVPDILPTGRGEMGLLLALERGRSVLERLRDPKDRGACEAEPPFPDDLDGRRAERLRTRIALPAPAPPKPEPDPAPGKTADITEKERLARIRAEESREINANVLPDRRQADKQADARAAYAKGSNADAVKTALEELSGCKASCASPVGSARSAAGSAAALGASLDRVRTLHAAATRITERDATQKIPMNKTPEELKNIDAARARFFGIQSQPALARLFNLAIDVLVPLDGTLLAFGQATPRGERVTRDVRGLARFAFVTARVGAQCGPRLVWTTSKARLPGSPDDNPKGVEHFWACTREELDARAINWTQDKVLDSAIATQTDGLLDLGAARVEGGVCNPRYDLLTLDAPRVSEADVQVDAKARRSLQRITPVATVASAGLILVDRWRQYAAVAQAVASVQRREPTASPQLIVDVEDLTVGLKLDVGVDDKKRGPTTWRSLVERTIAFGDGKETDFYDAAIGTLVPDDARRRELTSATLTLPARLRANNGAPAGWDSQPTEGRVADGVDLPKQSAFVEEIVAQWNGPPLGVDLQGNRESESVRNPGSLPGTGLLQLSQTHSLPAGGAGRPPRQRFGWAYRVGVRPQLAGGVAMPLAKAGDAYNGGYRRRFALPPSGGRRVLRHERIEGPVITTPLGILQRPVRGPRETATELVVRTTEEAKDGKPTPRKTLEPRATHRVLVPPPVTLEFADRHDVYPSKASGFPAGGLRGVDYDREPEGGFPVWSTQERSAGGLYAWPKPLPAGYPKPTGDAAFQSVAKGVKPELRRSPYYPDPAADFMVFRLRRLDGADVFGQSLIAPVRHKGVSFPEVTPIVVEVVPTLARSGKAATQERILGLDVGKAAESFVSGEAGLTQPPAAVFVDETPVISRAGGGGKVRATRVRVLLEPGEAFQLDAWCAPSAANLAYWFDVVESVALVADARAGANGACPTREAFMANVAAFLDGKPAGVPMAALGPAVAGTPPGCGAGQLPLPDPDALGCVANVIHAGLLSQVMPEIAARTTLKVTHALDKPYWAPSFTAPLAEPAGPRLELSLIRLDVESRQQALAASRTGPHWDMENWSVESTVPDSTDVAIGGTVTVDVATTRFLELRATGSSLVSAAFDDPRRGRSVDDRARGIWPDDRERNAPAALWRNPVDVFGFRVAPDGTVEFPPETTTLIRIDDLGPATKALASDTVDLLARQRLREPPRRDDAEGVPPSDAVKGVTYPGRIPDTKARILQFELVAGSSTAPLIYDGDDAALDAAAQTRTSLRPKCVALPATKAPARVDPLTLLPAFALEPATVTQLYGAPCYTSTRTTRIRLRVRRPWFSSGAGERLGIVLWPPAILDGGVEPDNDRAHRGYDTEPGEALMNLRGFSDLDLGPGGAFVSRWGGDPIKAGPRPTGWLLPPSHFRDVSSEAIGDLPRPGSRLPWTPLQDGADANEVVYVPRATMPLPADPGDAKSSGERPTMEVALLAYRPRFDVDAEHWYFDLHIDPSLVPEAFVRLGLVRYQANAPKALRVSEPVVEWAQLLPKRVVAVTPVGRRVQVRVTGAGSPLPIGAGGAGGSEDRPPGILRHGPLMKVTVYRRSKDGIETVAALAAPEAGEQATRERVALTPTEPTPPCEPDVPLRRRAEEAVTPQTDKADGLVWDASFDIDDDPRAPTEADVTYSVVVTEVHVMRPGTYPDEPFDPAREGTDDRLVQSGPRFAARVAIPRRDAPQAPERPGPAARILAVHEDDDDAQPKRRA